MTSLQQQEFLSYGLAARDEARKTGEYYSVAGVLQKLDEMLVSTHLAVRHQTENNSHSITSP